MKVTRFKPTEIGMIPEDWEVKKLGSTFKFIPNNTIPRDNLTGQGKIMNVHYGDILIKYGSILDIEKNDIPFIDDKIVSRNRIIEFAKDGDILIADTAEDEMVCKATEIYNIKNRKLVSGLHTMWIRPTIEFKPKYLGYFFNSSFYHNQILPLIQGTKVCSVSKSAIKDTYISIPLEDEQKNIASALTSIDNLLLSLDKLIEKKKLIKQGAMQELLTGKKRLPGFTGEWVEKKLGEGLRFKPGFPFNSNFFDERMGIRLIRNRDLKADDQITYFCGNANKDFIIENGDLLIGMDGDFMPCLWNKGKALLNQRVGKIELISNNWCLMYLFYALQNPLKAKQEKTGATTVKHLSHSDIEQMRLKMPTNSIEQKVIGKILSSMDKEIESLEAKKTKYEQIKQGMMQQLLTGKIRLIS